MNAVRENPYRTLGLFGNATEKELQKQIATIKRFAEVGKLKSFDYDFPFLGDFNRERETVVKAASSIEQAKNKVHYSLFWFLNTNHIDEAALNHLKEANIDKATEIWEKLIKDNTITAKNYSAALNLSTLQLGMTTLNGSFNPAQLKKCVQLKGHIISSDAFLNFVQTVAGDNTSVPKDTIRKEFVDEVLQILKPYLNKSNGITSAQLIDAFSSFPTETKQYVSAKFTDRPLSNIDNQVEKTKQKRTDNANDAEQYGEELYKSTKEDLAFLKNVMGASNVQYTLLANKVANEIFQCALDFYGSYKNDISFDPGTDTMRLLKLANSIATTGQTKSRIQENIENLQPLLDNPSKRIENIKFNKITDELAYITQMVEKMEKASNSISNAKNFSGNCKPKLDKIKTALGSTDEIYLGASSRVVHETMQMLIAVVNTTEAKLENIYQMAEKITALFTLKTTVEEVLPVFKTVGSFDMVSELKSRYNENLKALQSKKTQLEQALNPSSSRTSSSSGSSSGCYIATMAYGSYEHPQVLQLRKFRDETLAQSKFGRYFIAAYYKVSPKLVELLKNKKSINSAIRTLLNALIHFIK